MTKISDRERAIRKGRQLRKAQAIGLALRRIWPEKLRGEEIFVDTAHGKVRALCYGFENPRTTPVYLDLHGGGFLLGGAAMDDAINAALSRAVGCKIISIEYAKAPDFPYPAAVNQVAGVAKHVTENAEALAVDRRRMAIGGHSAGGNLSAVACLKAKKDGLFQFACQVLDYPPLDLATSAFDKPQPKGCIPPKMARIFDACYVDPAQAKDPYVSPVYASPADLAGLPPALFILAGRDSLRDEGLRYRAMLDEAGVPTECYDYPDAAHGFTLNPSADAADALEKIAAFLKKHLYE